MKIWVWIFLGIMLLLSSFSTATDWVQFSISALVIFFLIIEIASGSQEYKQTIKDGEERLASMEKQIGLLKRYLNNAKN
jgi:hypothetical protein